MGGCAYSWAKMSSIQLRVRLDFHRAVTAVSVALKLPVALQIARPKSAQVARTAVGLAVAHRGSELE